MSCDDLDDQMRGCSLEWGTGVRTSRMLPDMPDVAIRSNAICLVAPTSANICSSLLRVSAAMCMPQPLHLCDARVMFKIMFAFFVA